MYWTVTKEIRIGEVGRNTCRSQLGILSSVLIRDMNAGSKYKVGRERAGHIAQIESGTQVSLELHSVETRFIQWQHCCLRSQAYITQLLSQ